MDSSVTSNVNSDAVNILEYAAVDILEQKCICAHLCENNL